MQTVKDIRVLSAFKVITAFLIGAGIQFATYLFFGRADGGIFAVFLSPFIALYTSAKFISLAIATGLIFYLEVIKRKWFMFSFIYKGMLVLSLLCFIYSTNGANEAYYDYNNRSLAQWLQDYLINPSFVVILFCLCYRPLKQETEWAHNKIEPTEPNQTTKENETTKHSYTCDEGELVIEQKGALPSANDKAFLNGEPAPTNKYQIGENQFVMVSNGNIYAVRGF